jgi:hypothetical protein
MKSTATPAAVGTLVSWGVLGILIVSLASLSACSGTQVRAERDPTPLPDRVVTPAPPKADMLQPGWADVWCRSSVEPGVDYMAPGYDKMSEGLGKARPNIRWSLTDMGGDGSCYLLGIPERPSAGAAKYVLRSVKSFERSGGQCVCRPVRTRVQEGIYRPKTKK